MIYRFLNRRLRRGKEDAKHSALSIEVVYISFFVPMIVCTIGLLYDNVVSRSFLYNEFSHSVIIAVISYIALRIRYYKFFDVEDIEKKLTNISIIKKIIYKWTTRSLLVLVPILVFIFFRLYKFRHI
jgi:hypothetical protein